MKALSVLQPWATLIAIGAKRIETRSWRAPYRGRIAIHASKSFPRWCKDLCLQEPFVGALLRGIYGHEKPLLANLLEIQTLRLGMVLCTVDLIDCVRVEDVESSPQERAFGDFSPNRFAWLLGDVRVLENPVSAKGSLSLWEWEEK
jgi:hypothetical protein